MVAVTNPAVRTQPIKRSRWQPSTRGLLHFNRLFLLCQSGKLQEGSFLPIPAYAFTGSKRRGLEQATGPRRGTVNCGRVGHWARVQGPDARTINSSPVKTGTSARKFVGHSLNFKMPYMQDRWLFNVRTSSRSEVGPAEVLIGAGQPSEVHNGWQLDGSYSQGTCQAA